MLFAVGQVSSKYIVFRCSFLSVVLHHIWLIAVILLLKVFLSCSSSCPRAVNFIRGVFQALVVYECLSEWGQILCAICPNLKLVITGGTSTAICVWETGTSKERAKSLTLKQANKTVPHFV